MTRRLKQGKNEQYGRLDTVVDTLSSLSFNTDEFVGVLVVGVLVVVVVFVAPLGVVIAGVTVVRLKSTTCVVASGGFGNGLHGVVADVWH